MTRRRRRSTYDVLPQWLTRKRAIVGVLLASFVFASVFGVRLSFALGKAFRTDPVSAVIAALQGGNGSSIDVKHRNLSRINIMLYGYGGDGHNGAYLADSIMLISIQPSNSGLPQVAEISLPRDWYVPIALPSARAQFGRINEAYADGKLGYGALPGTQPDAGAAVANATIEHLLGIHIDHWVGVDFRAFKAAVDAVGGIDVTVVNSFTDSAYPHGECDLGDCSYETVHFNAGPQHMNGTTALIFARSRHGTGAEGSDFARSRRQQLIIAALKQKAVSLGGIGNLPDLLNALGDNVVTDLKIGDVEALFGLVKDVDVSKVEHISIDNTNFLYTCNYPSACGAYYMFAHDSTFQSLDHFVAGVFARTDALAEHARVMFEDASGRGLGASVRWASLLTSMGISAIDGGRVATSAATQVIDLSGGADARTAQWLAAYFGVQVTKPTPPPTSLGTPAPSATAAAAPVNGGVVVVLGSAEESAFLGHPGIGS